ncbi:hypothetical protein HQ531_09810 [bacterium]|nr:hypothetical protein [bacterium]
MLAIHISRDTLKFAQLVNFKGTPFIESLGKLSIKEGLQVPDTTNSEVILGLAEQITNIRNSAEFPDNATHIVIDSDWFPLSIHQVDSVLDHSEKEKYLTWRMSEMLETAYDQYSLVHQVLRQVDATSDEYLSLGIPHSFSTWIDKIVSPSELGTKNVILDIQALGDMLAVSGQLDSDGGIQVVMENQENAIRCHIFQNLEFCALFHAALNWDYTITVDNVRGNSKMVDQVAEALGRALKGKQNPDNAITNLFYFNSSGDPAVLHNLAKYGTSCQKLNLADHFNFRDPDFENIDEYAVVLGALSVEIQERFSED